MSQSDTDRAVVAQERSRETESFVRTVKAATRRKYTPEEKIRIVLEGFRREVTVSDLCRREGIRPHSYYSWTKKFMEAGRERSTRDSVRDATRQEIQQLRRENAELKQLWSPSDSLPQEGHPIGDLTQSPWSNLSHLRCEDGEATTRKRFVWGWTAELAEDGAFAGMPRRYWGEARDAPPSG